MQLTSDALLAALAEIERHVGHAGWDSVARLFALVPTQELLAAEPSLAAQLAHARPVEGALSSIEQEGFAAGDDPLAALERIGWPDTVAGCAIAIERAFLPPEAETGLPDDPYQAAQWVANHPQRQDIRLVAGALRTGERHCIARVRSAPEELLGGPDLVPAVTAALAHTLDQIQG